MRRRTKPRVVWIPQDPSHSSAVDSGSTSQIFLLDVVGDIGSQIAGEIPLVIDAPQDPLTGVDISLSDMFNSGYRLRRIVGKIWVTVQQIAEDTPRTIIVTAGIIVRRVDQADASLSLAASSAGAPAIINPGQIENTPDPWIWRRSWMLNNNLSTATGGSIGNNQLPESNQELGSAVDGPHVDQRTARVVGPEERLFLDVGANVVSANGGLLTTLVRVDVDLRTLVSLRTNVGNRRNASR